MGQVAHEVNNALNGAAMNVEVLRLRAVAGRDAGALAPFAAAAAAEQDAVASLTTALLALAREPRAGETRTDIAQVCAPAARLVAAVVRHQGVTVDLVAEDGPAPTSAPADAVRLAVCAALDAGTAAAAARIHARDGSVDHSGPLRCRVLVGDTPALDVAPAAAVWPADLVAALAAVGVRVQPAGDGVRVVFPPP